MSSKKEKKEEEFSERGVEIQPVRTSALPPSALRRSAFYEITPLEGSQCDMRFVKRRLDAVTQADKEAPNFHPEHCR